MWKWIVMGVAFCGATGAVLITARGTQAELQRVRAYRRPEDEPGLPAKVEENLAALEQTRSDSAQAEASCVESGWGQEDHEAQVKRLEACAGNVVGGRL